jgi:hypothetical protein
MNITVETIGRSLNHWQALYIFSITLAVLSTFAIVVFAFHIQEHILGLKVSNYVYVVASLLAVGSTIVIVNKTKSLDAAKDGQVQLANAAAKVQIEQAKAYAAQALANAAIANQKAEEARLKAETASKENSTLRIEVSKERKASLEAEQELRKQNKDTFDYAHSLAQQQTTMAEQAHVSPVLTEFQVESLAQMLAPYKGQDVVLHSTLDTTVLRMKQTIAVALQKAGITFKQNSMDAGSLYQGVSVVVHSPQDVPPLANSLVLGLRSAGIDVHTVSLDTVPQGQVAIYLGPN